MRTRRGLCYPKICRKREDEMMITKEKRRRKDLCGGGGGGGGGGVENIRRKKMRPAPESAGRSDFFDGLPDDLVVCILCKLSSSAGSPSDFINVLITCKRFNGLGLHPLVLGKVSPKALAVRAKKWSESAHRFLKLCAEAGNIEACYTLGMGLRWIRSRRSSKGIGILLNNVIDVLPPAKNFYNRDFEGAMTEEVADAVMGKNTRVSNPDQVRMSNYDQPILSTEQVKYDVFEAYLGFQLAEVLLPQ